MSPHIMWFPYIITAYLSSFFSPLNVHFIQNGIQKKPLNRSLYACPPCHQWITRKFVNIIVKFVPWILFANTTYLHDTPAKQKINRCLLLALQNNTMPIVVAQQPEIDYFATETCAHTLSAQHHKFFKQNEKLHHIVFGGLK